MIRVDVSEIGCTEYETRQSTDQQNYETTDQSVVHKGNRVENERFVLLFESKLGRIDRRGRICGMMI